MLVGDAQAGRPGNYPFWLDFGYVVIAFKYTPKLLELIGVSKFDMIMAYLSWNQLKFWRWKPSRSITDNEPPGLCCRKGKVNIHILKVPAELKRLFTSQVHDDAKYFRKHIRYFNSHFSFTSLGVTLDWWVSTVAGMGIYTFRVQGGLYHRLHHLVLGSHGPIHLQLYFYDTEDRTLAHRAKWSPDLDINIIRNILWILQDNPYVQTFNRVGAFPNLDNYCI